MPRIFGREVALWAGLANSAVYLAGAFLFHLRTEQEAVLIAGFSALLGLIVAGLTHDGLSAAILGFAKALLVVALGFGAHVDAANQAILLAFFAALVAMFVRTQVTAPVPPLT